jgi:hypothetical protein
MKLDRFTDEGAEPRDYDRERDIADERADDWRDQAADREREAGELMTGRMPVVCNWFHPPFVMRFEPCLPKMHGLASHGMCPVCAERFKRENNL